MGRIHQAPGARVMMAVVCACAVASAGAIGSARLASAAAAKAPTAERMVTDNPVGHTGGRLVVALRSEPKTLNPVMAADTASRDVIRCLNADLIHINRESEKTEPALAKTWSVSRDGRQYTLHLRRGLQFSDGQPFTADDVVFSFRVYLDEKIHSPQRDLLIVGGKPIAVTKVNDATVRFELAAPYAAAERLFDSLAMLPKHLLGSAYESGNFSQAWGVGTAAGQVAGLGPFRLKEYAPGERLVLERNPYYWKQDRESQRLPYLDELTFLFVPSEDAQVIRFESGDTDVLSRFSAQNFGVLEKQEKERGYRLFDLGPGLEYNFLFFNLNDLAGKNLPEIAKKQKWFADVRFRQAVSEAIDREGIVRLVYSGRATPLWGQVTPGNKLWVDASIPHPARSLEAARQTLRTAGFTWNGSGALVDAAGNTVEFSILTSASNAQRAKMATIIQDDLSQLGMNVHVVTLDFGTVVDRLMKSYDYEAAVMGLASGDADPTPEMNVWLSSGSTHLWHLNEAKPATPWEAEIDALLDQGARELDVEKRRGYYWRIQEILHEQLPMLLTVRQTQFIAYKTILENYRPTVWGLYRPELIRFAG